MLATAALGRFSDADAHAHSNGAVASQDRYAGSRFLEQHHHALPSTNSRQVQTQRLHRRVSARIRRLQNQSVMHRAAPHFDGDGNQTQQSNQRSGTASTLRSAICSRTSSSQQDHQPAKQTGTCGWFHSRAGGISEVQWGNLTGTFNNSTTGFVASTAEETIKQLERSCWSGSSGFRKTLASLGLRFEDPSTNGARVGHNHPKF